MLVFRDAAQLTPTRELAEKLLASLHNLACAATCDAIVDALLRAGELECGLADAASGHAQDLAALTDALAELLIASDRVPATAHSLATLRSRAAVLERLSRPEGVRISPPEGFAYYALHPLAYAEIFERMPAPGRAFAAVGIRSIGTTLSAVVTAAARRRGLRAERITVRPQGHPFDRHTEFAPGQLRWIEALRAAGAAFAVVDEGPGLSGSSLLSVGEALMRAGVSHTGITLLCSHHPETASLVAPRAAQRWAQFRTLSTELRRIPPDAAGDVGGGTWRRHLPLEAAHWPASWPRMERAKYLSRDGRLLFKFEGLGRFGSAVLERSRALAAAEFAPAAADAGDGFVAYEMVDARPCCPDDADDMALRHLARYCAFRHGAFAAPRAPNTLDALQELIAVNLHEEFGLESAGFAGETPAAFGPAPPVITDGRMMPHEWLRTRNGRLIKSDGATHGDDHFFPGPTDIAWDLAGCIVEWQLAPAAAEFFLREYHRLTGDDARPRLPFFLLAYAAFRLGFCRMAAAALRHDEEGLRLSLAADRYRSVLAPCGRHAGGEASRAFLFPAGFSVET